VKACGALNVRGFYDPMRAMLERAAQEGFLKPEHRDMVVLEAEPTALLDALAAWQAPAVTKWIAQPGS
jgi:predicted Rossmann-fold nucleotide-binding protein